MLRRYGILGSIKLCFSLIYTKAFFPQTRLIRLPFDIRNKKYISLGKGFTTGFGCRIEAHPLNKEKNSCIIIGENVEINDYVHIASGEEIVIENNVLIASKVFITDLNHGNYSGPLQDIPSLEPNKRKLSTKRVEIQENVWIGEGVCVLPGVTIGKGSIIGAMSLVSKNIPPNCIAVGVPARVIKSFDFQKNEWINVR